MYAKLIFEKGQYVDIFGNEANMLTAVNGAKTSEGDNIGWMHFDSLKDAEKYFNLIPIEKIDEPEEPIEYPYEGRNIRVELTDSQLKKIVVDKETRPLMEWAYNVPNKKTSRGLILWFIDFENDLLTEAQTEGLLLSLGAKIIRK